MVFSAPVILTAGVFEDGVLFDNTSFEERVWSSIRVVSADIASVVATVGELGVLGGL